MTTKVTEETRKEKKSTPEKMLGWFILAPILLIAVAIIIAVWAKDSTKEVRKVTPTVAKRVESPSAIPSYSCDNVYIVAPVGRWSPEVPQEPGCDFHFLRDPLLHKSTADRKKNWNGMVWVSINGNRDLKNKDLAKRSGKREDGTFVSAYFDVLIEKMAFMSDEYYPIYLIMKFPPK